jgi:hypothetical protein
MTKMVEVLLHKGCAARIKVPHGNRKQIDAAIEATPRSEIVWKDDSKGVSATCITDDESWKPQRRFFLNGEGE